LKPTSRSALETFSMRRGWPSGLELSQIMSPLKPVSLEINPTNSFMEISKPAPILIGSGLLYFSAAKTIASAQSSTYKNSLVDLPVPQTTTGLSGFSGLFRLFGSFSLQKANSFPPIASIILWMRAGMTWGDSRSKLSLGP